MESGMGKKRVDGVSDEPIKDGESKGFDGTSRVLETKEMSCGDVNGDDVNVDDINVDMPLKEICTRKNIRYGKMGGKEDSVNGSGVEERSKEPYLGERIDRDGDDVVGEDGLTQKAECGDDDNDDGTKVVGDHGGEEEHSKSRGRRGRRSKIKSCDGRNSDGKVVDSDEKVAEVLGSISQRTRNRVVKGKKEEVKGGDVEQIHRDDHESGFCMGSFVWGKIRSHPWWPGRIYDPSNASDLASKYKHEGRLLVAYFGDGTFAWCDPSQLRPFEENFEEMSKQSSLKSFVNAVDEAVNEFCTLVELHMTRVSANKGQSSLPLVINAGIKEGVHLAIGGVKKSSVVHFEPAKILAEIRRFAKTISVTNMLELGVIKSYLSAFYHSKGGYLLPAYHEPLGIEVPVDIDTVLRDGLPRGPVEGDCSVSPEDLSVAQTGPETPVGGKSRRRRKEKSITELLGTDAKVELEANNTDGIKEEMHSGKVASKSGKKKRNVINEDQTELHQLNHDDNAEITKENGQSGKRESESGRKRRKLSGENQNYVVENSVTTRSRTRKREGAATVEKKPSSDKVDGYAKKDRKTMKRLPLERNISINVGLVNGHFAAEIHERISPREKKRSKYLSPPYTSPLPKQRNVGLVGGHLEFSDVAKMGERMSKAAGKLVGSPPLVKCSGETLKSPKGSSSVAERSQDTDNQASKMELRSRADGSIKSIGSSDEVLSEMRSAARDPLTPRKDQSFDSIKGFLSSYRNANYKDGADQNLYKKHLADQKKGHKNSSNAKHGSDRKLRNRVAQEAAEPKTPRSIRKKKEQKSDSKAENQLANGSVSSAALLMTFPHEFTLPTKEDLIKMHSKFGLLDESKTKVRPKAFSAEIVFLKSSDAEAAVDSMQKTSPFGTAKVTYQVQHLAASSSKTKHVNAQNMKKIKMSERQEGESSEPNPPAAPENEPLTVIFIKQKLEAMNSMLAQTDGKMSEETKSNLENEVEQLLKKVKMMTGSSSASSS